MCPELVLSKTRYAVSIKVMFAKVQQAHAFQLVCLAFADTAAAPEANCCGRDWLHAGSHQVLCARSDHEWSHPHLL